MLNKNVLKKIIWKLVVDRIRHAIQTRFTETLRKDKE